jgi:hypothetical protein
MRFGFCPECNSSAPELDHCPTCEGYHSAKGDPWPPAQSLKDDWWLRFNTPLCQHGRSLWDRCPKCDGHAGRAGAKSTKSPEGVIHTMRKYLLITICGLLFPHNSYSLTESDAASDIVISGVSTTSLGESFIVKLKQSVRDSKDFRLVSDKDGSVILNIISCSDGIDANSDNSIAYSVAWTIGVPGGHQHYLTSQVGVCGRNRISDLPAGILEKTRSILEEITSKRAPTKY